MTITLAVFFIEFYVKQWTGFSEYLLGTFEGEEFGSFRIHLYETNAALGTGKEFVQGNSINYYCIIF